MSKRLIKETNVLIEDFTEQEDSSSGTSFVDAIMQLQKPSIEAAVYAARHQGLRAGVRPNAYVRQPGEEKLFVPARLVFVDYPEKTVTWGFRDTEENASWLDEFPQYDS